MLFYKFQRDSRNEKLFWEINVIRAILGDIIATAFSTIIKNDILRFLDGGRGRV